MVYAYLNVLNVLICKCIYFRQDLLQGQNLQEVLLSYSMQAMQRWLCFVFKQKNLQE